MPPAREKTQRNAAATDSGPKCKICRKAILYNRLLTCDLCTEPICVSCTKITEGNYDYMQEEEIEIPFLCSPCRKELPKLRELLNIKVKHDELQQTVEQLEVKINKLKTDVEDAETENVKIKKRVSDLEEIIDEKKINSKDFPPLESLEKITSQSKQFSEIVLKQQSIDDKLNKQREEKVEEKRIEEKEKNLIVYGIPEKFDDPGQQMKNDFETINEIYMNRVNIREDDIINIIRLGTKNDDQIRPIKITFESTDKRMKVLRNNKNLVLYDDSFPECKADFCNLKENHKHIYVSTDKTKQQRDTEKTLRQELKERKAKGETNITIRNFKIVKTTVRAYPCWADVANHGY